MRIYNNKLKIKGFQIIYIKKFPLDCREMNLHLYKILGDSAPYELACLPFFGKRMLWTKNTRSNKYKIKKKKFN